MTGTIEATPPFSIGATINATFGELSRRFAYYALLVAIPLAPLIALGVLNPAPVLDPETMTQQELGRLWLFVALSTVLGMLAYSVAMGAFAYAVVASKRGNPIGLPQALGEGLRRLPYTASTLLVLTLVAVLLYLAAVVIVVAASLGLGLALGQLGRLAGMAIGVAGGLYVLFRFLLPLFVAWPVAAAESAWPLTALRRSRFLTKDRLWPLFGVLAVLFVVFFVFGLVIAFGLAAVFGVSFFDPASVQAALDSGELAVMNVVSAAISLPLYAFAIMTPVVVYYLLSVERDGRDVGHVSDVFE